jgi:hypothetical protein
MANFCKDCKWKIVDGSCPTVSYWKCGLAGVTSPLTGEIEYTPCGMVRIGADLINCSTYEPKEGGE